MFLSPVRFADVEGVARTAVAAARIPQGAVVCDLREAKVSPQRGRFTIQVGAQEHLEGPGTFFHSCDPNCQWVLRKLIARRDIPAGEAISFDYCTTEAALVNDFTCACGSSRCYGRVRGYRFLTPAQREAIRDRISPFLASLRR